MAPNKTGWVGLATIASPDEHRRLRTAWSATEGNHTYIFWRGVPIWKRWDGGGRQVLLDLHFTYWLCDGKGGGWV